MRDDLFVKGLLSFSEYFAIEFSHNYMGKLPKLLIYYPFARVNPFQVLLYSASFKFNYMTLPCINVNAIDMIRWRGKSIIHIHWLSQIFLNTTSAIERKKRIVLFIEEVKRWKSFGYKILWTMHNTLPHNSIDPESDCMLRVKLVEQVDLIHIMNADSIALAKPWYDIPRNKAFFVPHVSFKNYYPNYVSKYSARTWLALPKDAFCFLFFGSLSRYKNVEKLIIEFSRLSTINPQAYLLIAGSPADKKYVAEIIQLASHNSRIKIYPNKIPDFYMQHYINASDFVVIPYQTLNSGIAVMAADFDKHCIGPINSAVSSVYGSNYRFLFCPHAPNSLYDALSKAISSSQDFSVSGHQQGDLSEVSSSFFKNIDKLLEN